MCEQGCGKTYERFAFPDSRFDFDFSSFIADFEGSKAAADALLAINVYRSCKTVFITPDNCLEYLREKTLEAGIQILMTTYGIRRGFWLLNPGLIQPELYKYASTLDGMERLGQLVSLKDIVDMKLRPGVMVTGTGAINYEGVRFGKGHGYYDLEWAMLYTIGVVRQDTLTVAIVHDCQMLDEELRPDEFDTVCDLIVTPTRKIEVGQTRKPTCGILWDKLQDSMLDIPPLQELMERSSKEGGLGVRRDIAILEEESYLRALFNSDSKRNGDGS